MGAAPLYKNRLLRGLSPDHKAALTPHLEAGAFPIRHYFELEDRPIKLVFFPDTGVVSVVAKARADQDIEVGLIGSEGMTGLPLLMGDDQWPNSAFVQIASEGWIVSAKMLIDSMTKQPELRVYLLRYAKAFLVQSSHTALANGRASVLQRLARWLLMAQDRIGSAELVLTHEFISTMLAVRRASVTDHLLDLERDGLIEASRGRVRIIGS